MERNKKLDISKFVAMTCIILAHCLQRTMVGFVDSFIGTFLIMIGLPIFFFLSGISCSYRKPMKPLAFLYDIIKRGFYYLWPITLFLIFRVAFYSQWPDVPTAFNEFWAWPVNGLWFLWILLWLNIVTDLGLLISIFLPKYKKIFVFGMLLIGYMLLVILHEQGVIWLDTLIGYDYFIAYTPIFLIGYLFGDKLFTYVNKWLSLGLLLFGLTILIITVSLSKQIIQVNLIEHLPVFYVSAVSSLLIHYGASTLLEKVKVGSIFALCGRFTLEAYFLHLLLLKAFNGMSFIDPGLCTGYTIAFFLLCIVDIAAVVAVIYFIPFGSFLLFGRSHSAYRFEKNFFNRIKEFCYKY